MLCHLGVVTACSVIIQMRVTDNRLLFLNEFEVLADFLKDVLIGGVPCTLSQQVVGVLVGSLIREGVQVDLGTVETGTEIVNRLQDLTAHFPHLV